MKNEKKRNAIRGKKEDIILKNINWVVAHSVGLQVWHCRAKAIANKP